MRIGEPYVSETDSFVLAVTKTFVVSTVISAGTIAGFVVAGYGYTKIQEMRENRKQKKESTIEA